MLLKRAALDAAIPATTPDDTRYFLRGIQIDPAAHTYTATNGHVLVRVTDTAPTPDSEFPAIPGTPFTENPGVMLLPADVAVQVVKSLPKKPTIPVRGMAQLAAGADGASTVATTDLDTPQVRTVRAHDATFPNADRVLPKPDRAAITLMLSTDVLQVITKAARAVCGGGTAKVAFNVATEGKQPGLEPVGFTVTGTDGLRLVGVVMPMRP